MKSVLAFIVLVVVVVAIGYGLQTYSPQEEENGTITKAAYFWEFRGAGEVASLSAPLTEVILNAGGERYSAGTYLGSCADMAGTADYFLPGEVAAALCWFAGAGHEVGVFEGEGAPRVMVGDVDEGSAEAERFRGNFRTLFELGPDARIARVEAGIGERASALGILFLTPLAVLEDSRCPIDVQCMQAGTVRVRTRIESELGTSETDVALGTPVTAEAETVTLIEAWPIPHSGADIADAEYRFVFSVAKR